MIPLRKGPIKARSKGTFQSIGTPYIYIYTKTNTLQNHKKTNKNKQPNITSKTAKPIKPLANAAKVDFLEFRRGRRLLSIQVKTRIGPWRSLSVGGVGDFSELCCLLAKAKGLSSGLEKNPQSKPKGPSGSKSTNAQVS